MSSGLSAPREPGAARDGSGWERRWDERYSREYYVNVGLDLSQWEAPQGVTFTEEQPQTSVAAEQRPQVAAAATSGGPSVPVPPNLTLRQFLRSLEKSQDGRWVKSASLTADVTQQKRVAIEMITVLAAQLLEEDPEVIRKNSVNEDGMLALGSALLARVNW